MRRRADARGAEGQSIRLFPGIADQIRRGLHRQGRARDQKIGRRRADHDRREDIVDVERPVAVGAGGNRHQRAGGRHQQRVAIGRRFHRGAGADRARGARLVLHHDRLTPFAVEILRDDARQHVGAAAGGERHDHLDGVVGIFGGLAGSANAQTDSASAAIRINIPDFSQFTSLIAIICRGRNNPRRRVIRPARASGRTAYPAAAKAPASSRSISPARRCPSPCRASCARPVPAAHAWRS